MTSKLQTQENSKYHQSYKGFANTLRAWLIAYGIGGPFLIVSQQSIWHRLSFTAVAWIAALFLLGVLLQVGHTMIFKWAQWKLYIAEKDGSEEPEWAFKLSHNYWVDHVTDIGSVLLFAVATAYLAIAVATGPQCVFSE